MKIEKKALRRMEVTIEEYTLCDKCNEKIIVQPDDAFECKFTLITGIYLQGNDGSFLEKSEIDMCHKCASEALNLLTQHGFKPNHFDV